MAMKVLVTGGGGFLGGALVRRLVARGDDVRSFSRSVYTELDKLGVEQLAGDLGDLAAVERAVSDCDLVFHVAAKAGYWGRFADYYRTNVVGTQNVLAACRKHAVRRLVYTSSPSVVFGRGDHRGIDESTPYPRRYLAYYPRTKAEAERLVLAANDANVATVALRPHLLWGPGDHHVIPRFLERARAGTLRRIGDGQNIIDTTYIDNAVDGHLLAAERLQPGCAIGGKVYFLAQGEPLKGWEFVDRVLAAADLPPVCKSLPASVAYAAGAVLELIHYVFRLPGEPRMTRFLATQFSTSHWFDLTAARRDLGYAPAVSLDEGMRRLREHFQAEKLVAATHGARRKPG